MKTKDQHNQNPEESMSNQEENSLNQNETTGSELQPETMAETTEVEPVLPESSAPVEAEASVEVEPTVQSEPTVEVEPTAEVEATVEAEPTVEAEDTVTSEDSTDPAAAKPAKAARKVTKKAAKDTEMPVVEDAEIPAVEDVKDQAGEVSAEVVVEEVVSDVKDIKEHQEILLEHADEEEMDEVEELHAAEASTELEGLTREQLVEKLEELVTDSNVNTIKSAVSAVKVAFLRLNKEFKHEEYQKLVEQNVEVEGDAPVETPALQDDPLEERFKAAFNIYKYNKAKFNEEQEKIKVQNLVAKTLILEELKALINSEETLKKTYDEFKTLQDRWKTIGMVPKNDVNTLWQNYHFLVEKFFDKVKINKELKDLDLKKNLEAKMQLCEKAEELLLETSIIKSFKQLQQYHEEWKEIGPVPQDKKDELWDRFKSATEKINERRREYYTEVQDGQEQNLTAKQILCEKVEQVLTQEVDSIKGWQDASNQITELLKIWKTIGPAPKKQNNEIWARFKSSLDNFFNAKKDFFNKLKEQQMHNYNLKLDLCLQAESLRLSTDWKNTTRELINLQADWKKIGPVPRKQSDRIWKRFRAACDEFFTSKTEYFKNIQSHEDENLRMKLDLIEKVKAFEIGDDRNQAVEALKDYQRQWMEIGFIPIKEKERIQNEFRSLINKHFEKLKVDSFSMGAQNYRNRLERMSKDAPEAGRIISKERNFLLGKIQQLQEDIKLWENNIGFFAESKTANLLKTEFEKKIAKAKEELVGFEAKLKMLRESNQ